LNKNDLILYSIIKEYLKIKEPIGSEHLKKNLDMDISSATIRNYFKKMMDEGTLYQEHASGGRLPTKSALKDYWLDKLKVVDDIYISNLKTLEQKAIKLDIFCIVKFLDENKFRYVENILDTFLLVVFDKNQFVIDYNLQIQNLLKPLAGIDIYELREVCSKLGVTNICEHIDFITKKQYSFINKKSVFRIFDYEDVSQEKIIFDLLSCKDFDLASVGISFEDSFPKDVMRLKTNALIEGENAELLCIGEIQKDFEYFFSL